VARHVLLELFLGVGDDREVLGGDAVALGTVAVATEGDAPSARLACREDDAAADARREVLLEDAAIYDFTREMRHRSSSRWAPPARPSCWSTGQTRLSPGTPGPVNGELPQEEQVDPANRQPARPCPRSTDARSNRRSARDETRRRECCPRGPSRIPRGG